MTACSNIFLILVTIHYLIHSSVTASRNKSMKAKKGAKHRWTPQEEGALIFIDESTREGKGRHFDRIKSEWQRFSGNSNVSDEALYQKLHRLRRESLDVGELKRNYKWDQKLNEELLEVYFNTSPYKHDAPMTLEEEWSRRHPNHQLIQKTLLNRLRCLLGGLPKYKKEESPHVDFEWEMQHDSDLIHAYNVALAEGKHHMKHAHAIWSELYPQYSHTTPKQLKKRYDHLKMNPPNKYFPWTQQENEELLNIFHETMSDKENQGQKIYNMWTKIHPRYSFVTPYYLQVHASDLAQEKESEELGRLVRTTWTNELKSDLVDIHHRYSGVHNGLSEFHKEWARRHPRLAYHTIHNLGTLARRYADQGYGSTPGKNGGGSSRRQYNTYTPGEKQNMLEIYDQTSPRKTGHTKRLMEQYEARFEHHPPIKPAALKVLMKGWKEEELKKQRGKAPMVDPSDEPESSSRLRSS